MFSNSKCAVTSFIWVYFRRAFRVGCLEQSKRGALSLPENQRPTVDMDSSLQRPLSGCSKMPSGSPISPFQTTELQRPMSC